MGKLMRQKTLAHEYKKEGFVMSDEEEEALKKQMQRKSMKI